MELPSISAEAERRNIFADRMKRRRASATEDSRNQTPPVFRTESTSSSAGVPRCRTDARNNDDEMGSGFHHATTWDSFGQGIIPKPVQPVRCPNTRLRNREMWALAKGAGTRASARGRSLLGCAGAGGGRLRDRPAMET